MSNDVPLKDHIEAQIRWVDRYFEDRIRGVDRHFEAQVKGINDNVKSAAFDLGKRLEGMNEFRDTLKDQAGRLATKDELNQHIKAIDDRVKSLEMTKANFDGKVAIVSIGVASVVSILVSILTITIVKLLH